MGAIMAKQKADKKDARRIRLDLSEDEYARLVAAASRLRPVPLPGPLAKRLVLEGAARILAEK